MAGPVSCNAAKYEVADDFVAVVLEVPKVPSRPGAPVSLSLSVFILCNNPNTFTGWRGRCKINLPKEEGREVGEKKSARSAPAGTGARTRHLSHTIGEGHQLHATEAV